MTPPELFGFRLFQKSDPDIRSAESGFIAAAKPVGRSSFWVVKRFRHTFGLKKIGHAGTLDPAASGLMILAFGKATRSIEQVQALTKIYRAELCFGGETASQDAETPVLETAPWEHITAADVRTALTERFTGPVTQIPPMYSALKVDGRRLYDLARKGQEVERAPRTIQVYRAELLEFAPPRARVEYECSKGTYVRTLAADLGRALQSRAYLTGLERLAIGPVRLDDALDTPLHTPA